MPYNSIADLPPDVKKLPEHQQKAFLAAFNSAYSGTCKDKGDKQESCAFAIAWSAAKGKGAGEEPAEEVVHTPAQEFLISAGAAENVPLKISGPLIEIGSKNKNGWGIPEDEVQNIIKDLEGTPLKICSGQDAITNEHSCDYNWDPKAAIGTIKQAFQKDGWIHATGQVTDSEATRKVKEDTWPKKWSVFLTYRGKKENGMLTGTKGRSVTLVRKPAYPGAGFKAGGAMEEIDTQDGIFDEVLLTAAGIQGMHPNLIPGVKATMPQEGIDLYTKTYNDAKNGSCKGKTGFEAMSCPIKAAWTAVKQQFIKGADGKWVKKGAGAAAGMDYNRNDVMKVLDFITANPGMMDQDMKNRMFSALDMMGQKEGMKMTLTQLKSHPEMMDQTMMDLLEELAGEITIKKNGGSILTKEGEQGTEKIYTQGDLDKAVAAAVEKAKADSDEKASAAIQEATKGMMPRAEAEKMISASVEKAKEGTLEQLKHDALVKEVAELQVGAGMIKPEQLEETKKTLEKKTAAALEEDKALLVRVKGALESAGASAIDKFKKAALPGQGTGKAGGFTVGRYVGGKYEVT